MQNSNVHHEAEIVAPVYIHPTAKISAGAKVQFSMISN
jgi:NDP-sugar pyrophosphorylase family protein